MFTSDGIGTMPPVKIIETAEDRRNFVSQVLADLDALEILLKAGRFEKGARRVGLEQEINLVDEHWRPALVGEKVLQTGNDAGIDNLVGEYARFNLELNLPPIDFGPGFMTAVRDRLGDDLKRVAEAARQHGAKLALVGILPSIRRYEIAQDALFPADRYRMLFDATQMQKGGADYEYHIEGVDELHLRDDKSILGGTFTSMQLHWQVDPDQAGRAVNWAQLIAAPQLAVACNSPIFLGKRLWNETRVALFEQTSDFRRRHETGDSAAGEKPRVSFGSEWCDESPMGFLDVFREDALRHKAYMRCDDEQCGPDPVEMANKGEIPDLEALQFHNGTVYRWNRPCIGTGKHPHVRIENRILAAGPTLADEMANAAFWWGLMAALPTLPERYADFTTKLPFDEAHRNFLAAARDGLDVQFRWPGRDKPVPAGELILDELLPLARQGLVDGGVDAGEADEHLGVLQRRAETGKTGARWILRGYETLREQGGDDEALVAVTAAMVKHAETDTPVHDWPDAETGHAGGWRERLGRVDEVMTREPYTVGPDDVLDLAAHLIRWRKIGHVPVVEDGKLLGVLTGETIVEAMGKGTDLSKALVKDAMRSDPITVGPKTTVRTATRIMRAHDISSLPVVDDNRLAGILTDGDLVRVLGEILKEELPDEEGDPA